MPNGMLSVKLSEMEIQIRRLHEKICVLETDELKNIKNEMEQLQKEWENNERILENKLRFSRAGLVERLSKAYDQIEQIIRQVQEETKLSSEEKLLLAEYSLDFVIQAANHALLICMDAIKEEMKQQDKKERKPL